MGSSGLSRANFVRVIEKFLSSARATGRGSVVRNAKMSFVVSPSFTLRTEVQRVHTPAKIAGARLSSSVNQTGGRAPPARTSFSEALVYGTTQRLSTPSHRRQRPEPMLRGQGKGVSRPHRPSRQGHISVRSFAAELWSQNCLATHASWLACRASAYPERPASPDERRRGPAMICAREHFERPANDAREATRTLPSRISRVETRSRMGLLRQKYHSGSASADISGSRISAPARESANNGILQVDAHCRGFEEG